MVTTSARWAGFVQYMNKATCYATPLPTTAVQLCKVASKITGTCVGHSSAFLVLPIHANQQQLPGAPFLLKTTCLPSPVTPGQGCSEACQKNTLFEEAGALHSAGPSTLSRSKQVLGKCHQETPAQGGPQPQQQSGVLSLTCCF